MYLYHHSFPFQFGVFEVQKQANMQVCYFQVVYYLSFFIVPDPHSRGNKKCSPAVEDRMADEHLFGETGTYLLRSWLTFSITSKASAT